MTSWLFTQMCREVGFFTRWLLGLLRILSEVVVLLLGVTWVLSGHWVIGGAVLVLFFYYLDARR